MISDDYKRYLIPIYYRETPPRVPIRWELATRKEAINELTAGELCNLNKNVDERFAAYSQERCSGEDLLEEALEENLIKVMVEYDIDEIEEDFQSVYSKKHLFEFGVFEEWEIFKELNIKLYLKEFNKFKDGMSMVGIYFYEVDEDQWWRVEQ